MISHCIVPTITFSAHTLFYKAVVVFQDIGKSMTGILRSPIGMKYQFFSNVI